MRGGIFAHILLEDGSLLKTPQTVSEFQNNTDAPRRPSRFMKKSIADFNPGNWEKFLERVNSSPAGDAAYVINLRPHNRVMVYGAYLGEDDGQSIYLYINSPIQPIDATRTVLQNQLIIVSVLSVLLSFVLAYFIAKRFSKPIKQTSTSAKELALGNYNVHFSADGYKEISELSAVLNSTAKELGKTEELRQDLMSNVSHDLKTPLTIIKSYAEMIRDISGDNKEKRNAHTGVIIDEANRLSTLVNDILNLTKLQQGIEEINKTKFSLSELVYSVVEKFAIYSEKENYQIICNVNKNISVTADENKIMQVLYNLIVNAINYTGEDKKIYINLKSQNGVARLEVKDTGEGIDNAEISKVWDRYYRTGKDYTRGIAGTGIGLSIVKHILEAHLSQYGVISKKGEGTSFWFELPLSM